jgi:hypothetical protein
VAFVGKLEWNPFPIFKIYRAILPANRTALRRSPRSGVAMKLYAPNVALFVIAGCLAMLGVLAAFPIALPIPALTGNPTWYIFLAWFLLAAGSAIPHSDEDNSE